MIISFLGRFRGPENHRFHTQRTHTHTFERIITHVVGQPDLMKIDEDDEKGGKTLSVFPP